MPSAIASYEGSLFWLAIFQGILAVLPVSAYKGWRYLIEGQRQRAAERIARNIRPGVEVELKDRRSSLHVHRHLRTARADAQGLPPKREGGPLLADIVPLDAHRQVKPSQSGWTPPA
jgi:hypothetical protein